MSDNWGEWEGRTVDGKYVLGEYLGGSEGSGVFPTRSGAEDAAIKLAGGSRSEVVGRLEQWEKASELKHPNLIGIRATGRWEADGKAVVYVVEEFAEENLGQIVPERALTPDEVRAMLAPVLRALEFAHSRGMAHGRIRPGNIHATGDVVKLSSDSLRPAGGMAETASLYDAPEAGNSGVTAAGDVWSLGITLVEVLTQRRLTWDAARMQGPVVPADVPEPFLGIARRCLELEPEKRCGMVEIRERLGLATRGSGAERTTTGTGAGRRGKWLLVAAMIAVLAVAASVLRRPHVQPERGASASEAQQAAEGSPDGKAGSAAPEKQPGPAKREGADANAGDEVVERVMPQVSPSAQRTVQGKIKVRVRVTVDGQGKVTRAALKDAGPSKYFSRVALEAAEKWRFAPADEESRTWSLLFSFTHSHMDAAAAKVK